VDCQTNVRWWSLDKSKIILNFNWPFSRWNERVLIIPWNVCFTRTNEPFNKLENLGNTWDYQGRWRSQLSSRIFVQFVVVVQICWIYSSRKSITWIFHESLQRFRLFDSSPKSKIFRSVLEKTWIFHVISKIAIFNV